MTRGMCRSVARRQRDRRHQAGSELEYAEAPTRVRFFYVCETPPPMQRANALNFLSAIYMACELLTCSHVPRSTVVIR